MFFVFIFSTNTSNNFVHQSLRSTENAMQCVFRKKKRKKRWEIIPNTHLCLTSYFSQCGAYMSLHFFFCFIHADGWVFWFVIKTFNIFNLFFYTKCAETSLKFYQKLLFFHSFTLFYIQCVFFMQLTFIVKFTFYPLLLNWHL